MYNGAVKGVISVRCGVDYIHIFSPYKFIIQLTFPREEIHNLRSRYSKKTGLLVVLMRPCRSSELRSCKHM